MKFKVITFFLPYFPKLKKQVDLNDFNIPLELKWMNVSKLLPVMLWTVGLDSLVFGIVGLVVRVLYSDRLYLCFVCPTGWLLFFSEIFSDWKEMKNITNCEKGAFLKCKNVSRNYTN